MYKDKEREINKQGGLSRCEVIEGFVPSALSSEHDTTRGGGPDPLFGFMSWRSSSAFDPEDEEIIFWAAFTMFEVER